MQTDWLNVAPGRGKGDDQHFGPWFCYLDGRNPDYPERILEAQYAEVLRRMDCMRADHGDPEEWDVHHWQDINPVHTEGLLQLACGGPQVIYHGGLLHARLRYFDAQGHRPGLPPDVGALVSTIGPESLTVELVNTHPLRERRAVLQAGSFGEHSFDEVTVEGQDVPVAVGAPHFEVVLPAGRSLKLEIAMRRYCRTPGYEQPV